MAVKTSKQTSRKKAAPGELLGRPAVAKHFDCSEASVRIWEQQKGMPLLEVGKSGKATRYSIKELDEWHAAFMAAKDENKSTVNSDLRSEKLTIEVKRDRLRLMTESGEVVLRSAIETSLRELFHKIRGRLESLPDELGTEVAFERRAEFVNVTKGRIHQLLKELESWSYE